MLAVSKLYVFWSRINATAAPVRSSSDGNFIILRCNVTFSRNAVSMKMYVGFYLNIIGLNWIEFGAANKSSVRPIKLKIELFSLVYEPEPVSCVITDSSMLQSLVKRFVNRYALMGFDMYFVTSLDASLCSFWYSLIRLWIFNVIKFINDGYNQSHWKFNSSFRPIQYLSHSKNHKSQFMTIKQ